MPRLHGAQALGAAAIGPAAVVARWRLADATILTIALNLGAEEVEFPDVSGELLWAEGVAGRGVSIAVWLAS